MTLTARLHLQRMIFLAGFIAAVLMGLMGDCACPDPGPPGGGGWNP